MERASPCPILHTPSRTMITPSTTNCCCKLGRTTHQHFLSHALSPRNLLNVWGKNSLMLNRLKASSGIFGQQNPSRELAVLLEVEGVLMDVHRLGNREAFNVAFRKMGLDCANWTEPIYLDLLRKSASVEEKMLILFFNKIGWPTSLPTSEKGSFLKSVLREKKNALDGLVLSKSLPLRPGVEEFIDNACEEGVPMIVLTAYSRSGDKVASNQKLFRKRCFSGYEKGEFQMCFGPLTGFPAVETLSTTCTAQQFVALFLVEQSFYGQVVLGKGVSSSLDEQLAKEAMKAASAEKQRIAEEVASLLKLSVEINTSSSESLHNTVAALRAGAEYPEVSVPNFVLVTGSQAGVAAAERFGMPCVVLRSSLTSRAEFPSANAVMDSFGGADLTISRLRNKRGS